MARIEHVLLAALILLIGTACVSIPPIPSQPAGSPALASATPDAGVAHASPSPVATVEPAPTDKPQPTRKPRRTPTPAPIATPTPTEPATTPNPDDPACFDDAYTLAGFSWNTIYRWRFNAASTPAGYDSAAVLAVIEKGFDNVTGERNDCGRPDNIHALAQYQGKTTQKACTDQADGVNTIAFGRLPSDLSPDTIAYTCPYTDRSTDIGYEADIVINSEVDWAMTPETCRFAELLEPTITHEAGHVFGLGHVSERQHPDLTMSTASNGWCDDSSSTLGLGDMLGLEKLYPGSQ